MRSYHQVLMNKGKYDDDDDGGGDDDDDVKYNSYMHVDTKTWLQLRIHVYRQSIQSNEKHEHFWNINILESMDIFKKSN